MAIVIKNNTQDEKKLPRGMRNNNPLNVRLYPNSSWVGMKENQEDLAFVQFTTLVYGYRAALIIIGRTYYKRGWNTVEAILTHFAPASENNTKAYINTVVKEMRETLGANFGKRTPLPKPSFMTMKTWVSLIAAMQNVECGRGSVYSSMIEKAFKMVFVK